MRRLLSAILFSNEIYLRPSVFVKEIFDEINDDNFIICYHNCGNAVPDMAESIAKLGADICHFGNAIELKSIIF